MKTPYIFDYKKATQAINYLANKYPSGTVGKMKVIKLIWAADRYHLRKYGRPIIGDDYVAMQYGPVGSSTKDIAGKNSFLDEKEKRYANYYLDGPIGNNIKSLRKPDLDVFSETDLEALDFSYTNFGNKTPTELVDISHQYPEWKKFKVYFDSKATTREPMSYMDFFKDPETTQKNDVFKEEDELVKLSESIFTENNTSAQQWT